MRMQSPDQIVSEACIPTICQIVVGHRSKELWTAGVPYQPYVEQAEIILLQNPTPPVTVVLGPTASYGDGALFW